MQSPKRSIRKFGNSVLDYIQGRNQSNIVSKFVNTKKIKENIIKKLEMNKSNSHFLLKRHSLFYNYLFEEYVRPNIEEYGEKYQYQSEYKIYMKILNDQEFYNNLKQKFKVFNVLEKRDNFQKNISSKEEILEKLNNKDLSFKKRFIEY